MNGNNAVILMYHRVDNAATDSWAIRVTPQRFGEQLEVIQKHAYPMRLQQLAAADREGTIPPRSVIVTFDDGYANNLHNAKPLLDRYDTPATVFVAAGYLGRDREFWWDELERLILPPHPLPESLLLTINGSVHRWELRGSAKDGGEDLRQYPEWRAWEEAPTPRHALYYSLWQLLRPLEESNRRALLNEIGSWTGRNPGDGLVGRALTAGELVALASGGIVEIGAHTVSHPLLSSLTAEMQRNEIIRSKVMIEEVVGQPVTHFAYPYGDYAPETVAIVKEAEFTSACSTRPGVAEQNTNRYELPRVAVEDWDGDEFAKRLDGWFSGSL